MFEFLRLLTGSFIIHSLVYAFEGFEEMTGYTSRDAVGKKIGVLLEGAAYTNFFEEEDKGPCLAPKLPVRRVAAVFGGGHNETVENPRDGTRSISLFSANNNFSVTAHGRW